VLEASVNDVQVLFFQPTNRNLFFTSYSINSLGTCLTVGLTLGEARGIKNLACEEIMD